MMNDDFLHLNNCRVDTVTSLSKFHTTVDVLRLDLIHPIVSGNKWFKLKAYLKEAQQLKRKSIVTFGGAYSNHILATAAASKTAGLPSIGIIRGEKPTIISPTLKEAQSLGMQLYFVSRINYKNKILPDELFLQHSKDKFYVINEGGYGANGMKGAKTILDLLDRNKYTHIVTAVGTGTTLAGLIEGSKIHQKIIGISVLKNNFSLQKEVEELIACSNKNRFQILPDYHFGGYAKYTTELIQFMNEWFHHTNIPSDFVYTGKLFYAVNDLIEKKFFDGKSHLLVVHSGGLQGNRSLPKGTLIF